MTTAIQKEKVCTLLIDDGPAINSLVASLSFSPAGDCPSVQFTARWGHRTFFLNLRIVSLKRLDEQRWTFEGVFPSRVNGYHRVGEADVTGTNYSTKDRRGWIEIPPWLVQRMNEEESEYCFK